MIKTIFEINIIIKHDIAENYMFYHPMDRGRAIGSFLLIVNQLLPIFRPCGEWARAFHCNCAANIKNIRIFMRETFLLRNIHKLILLVVTDSKIPIIHHEIPTSKIPKRRNIPRILYQYRHFFNHNAYQH